MPSKVEDLDLMEDEFYFLEIEVMISSVYQNFHEIQLNFCGLLMWNKAKKSLSVWWSGNDLEGSSFTWLVWISHMFPCWKAATLQI